MLDGADTASAPATTPTNADVDAGHADSTLPAEPLGATPSAELQADAPDSTLTPEPLDATTDRGSDATPTPDSALEVEPLSTSDDAPDIQQPAPGAPVATGQAGNAGENDTQPPLPEGREPDERAYEPVGGPDATTAGSDTADVDVDWVSSDETGPGGLDHPASQQAGTTRAAPVDEEAATPPVTAEGTSPPGAADNSTGTPDQADDQAPRAPDRQAGYDGVDSPQEPAAGRAGPDGTQATSQPEQSPNTPAEQSPIAPTTDASAETSAREQQQGPASGDSGAASDASAAHSTDPSRLDDSRDSTTASNEPVEDDAPPGLNDSQANALSASDRPLTKATAVDYGSEDMSRAAQQERRDNGWNNRRNVAVFEYTDTAGQSKLAAISLGRHSERRAADELDALQVARDKVTRIYTELSPCGPDYHDCDAWLYRNFPGVPVSYSFEYGPGREGRREAMKQLGRAVTKLFK